MNWQELLLDKGSLGLVFAALMAAGIGAPLPEDLTLIATGVLARRGAFSVAAALPVCFIGVVGGDLILFHLAKKLGPAAAKIARARRGPRYQRVERLFDRYGAGIVFGARFFGGMRAAAFGVAGARGMALPKFLLADAAAALLSVPLMIGLGFLFAGRIEHVHRALGRTQHGLTAAALAGLCAYLLLHWLQRRSAERAAGARGIAKLIWSDMLSSFR